MTEPEQELKPCPFCGYGRCKSFYDDEIFLWMGSCGQCGAEGSAWNEESTAIRFWNFRSDITPDKEG